MLNGPTNKNEAYCSGLKIPFQTFHFFVIVCIRNFSIQVSLEFMTNCKVISFSSVYREEHFQKKLCVFKKIHVVGVFEVVRLFFGNVYTLGFYDKNQQHCLSKVSTEIRKTCAYRSQGVFCRPWGRDSSLYELRSVQKDP